MVTFRELEKARSVYNLADVGLCVCVCTYVYMPAFAYVYVYEVYLLVYMHRNYVYTCSDIRFHECAYMCVCVYLHVSQDICVCLRSPSASSPHTDELFNEDCIDFSVYVCTYACVSP